jgi:hypothetical protein
MLRTTLSSMYDDHTIAPEKLVGELNATRKQHTLIMFFLVGFYLRHFHTFKINVNQKLNLRSAYCDNLVHLRH